MLLCNDFKPRKKKISQTLDFSYTMNTRLIKWITSATVGKKIRNLHNESDNAHGCMPKSSNDTFGMVQSGKLHFTSGHFKCNAVGFSNLMWNRPINSHYRVF